MKTMILATAAVLGLGVASAFAQSANANSGYVFPDAWGEVSAQQATSAPAVNHTDGASVGTYLTQSSHGTWLFPPNPNTQG